mgnify:CR=1 FL=1
MIQDITQRISCSKTYNHFLKNKKAIKPMGRAWLAPILRKEEFEEYKASTSVFPEKIDIL